MVAGPLSLRRRRCRRAATPLALMLIIVPLLGCQPTDPTQGSSVGSSRSRGEATPGADSTYGGTISTQFVSLPEQRAYPPPPPEARADPFYASPYFDVFRVAPGEALRGTLLLSSTFPDAKPLRLLLLVDYRQVAFALGPDPAAEHHAVTLLPGEEVALDLATPPLDPGTHDLALVAQVDPANLDRDALTRSHSTFSPVDRQTVIVGDAPPPSPPAAAAIPFDAGAESGDRFSDVLLLTADRGRLAYWSGGPVDPGETVTLYLRAQPLLSTLRAVGQAGPAAVATPEVGEALAQGQAVPVALVGLMDGRVVPIDATGATVRYGALPIARISTIEITITAPTEPGSHQFSVHQFPNPHVEVAPAWAGDQSFYSLATQRVVLDVQIP